MDTELLKEFFELLSDMDSIDLIKMLYYARGLKDGKTEDS